MVTLLAIAGKIVGLALARATVLWVVVIICIWGSFAFGRANVFTVLVDARDRRLTDDEKEQLQRSRRRS